ncbi:MAG: hypothetical protein H6719_11355 [Sandaracinaceae bacterium]|nr:hypothetical protein [Sandaracinaceae bacterium]
MLRALTAALLLMASGCDGDVRARDGDGGEARDAGPPTPVWTSDAGARADAGATDAGTMDAGSPGPDDAGSPAPDAGEACVSGTATWASYTVSDSDRSRGVQLSLDPDVSYRTLTVELEVEPGQWQPDCFNPASGRMMSPFQILLEVRKGERWCRGGNLFELAARGPTQNDLWVESYYAESVGSSCSGDQHEILASRPPSPLALGVSTPVRMHMDATTRAVDLDVGGVSRTGTMDPRLELVARAGEPLVLFTSIDRSVECYAPGGGPGDACCHLPAFGWTYRNLRYTACR